MAFNFFGLKKKPVIQDVVAKVPSSEVKPATMSFDEALARQTEAEAERVALEKANQENIVALAADNETREKGLAELAVAQEVAHTEPNEDLTSLAMLAQFDANQQEPSKPLEPVAETLAINAPEVLGQKDTLNATREDVIAAYKIFLGRLPESMEVVDPRVGASSAALLVDFLASKEFLDQTPKSQLVLAVAKKILDERKLAVAAEGGGASASAEQGQSAT